VVQPRPSAAPPAAPPSIPPNPGYNYAIGLQMYIPGQTCGVPGGGATLSVNWPSTLAWSTTWQSGGDHSLSQIWLPSPGATQGCTPPNCIQTVEMGWNVDPQLYLDNAPHFFTYSTKDGYRLTGCYNMEPTCSGSFGTMTGSGLVLVQNPVMIPGYALTVPQ